MTNNPVATSAGAQGISGALSILLMWAINECWGVTFPPEVSLSFSIVLGSVLHLACNKIGGCDTDGDGKPDIGAPRLKPPTPSPTPVPEVKA